MKSGIYSSFLRYRKMLDMAGLTVIGSLGLMFVLFKTDIDQNFREMAQAFLAILLSLQLILVINTYSRFRDGLRKLAEADDEHRALQEKDPLTGALNRSAFFEASRLALRAPHPETIIGFCQVDMDNLKVINDSFGHKAGDLAIVHLVATIRDAVPDAIIGRLGGDEFAMLVPGLATKDDLVALCRHLNERFQEPVSIAGHTTKVTATIGVAAAPQDGNSVELLTSHADLALYSGKNSGRNRVCVYESAMSAEEAYQRFVERELREAIFFNQLCLHYQPVFALDGNAPAAYEALVRWNHPFRGMISPSVFIPVAERSTLIDMIGEWVIRQACRDAKRLGGLPISVNVSPAQLRRAGFVDTILAILASEGASPSTFVLEVTETVEMRGGEVEIRNLAALRAAGFRIAIDDFGAGFTSLEYLKRFPFAAIKIDKGYIANIARNTVDLALVTAIAGIGRALDVRVIAEGVETEEQRQAVQTAGCTHIQGYLVGRPAPLAELERVRASDLSTLGRLLTTEAA